MPIAGEMVLTVLNKNRRKSLKWIRHHTGHFSLVLALLIPVLPIRGQQQFCDTLVITPNTRMLTLKRGYVLPETVHIQALDRDSLAYDSLLVHSLSGRLSGFERVADTLSVVVCYQALELNFSRQKILNPPPRIYLPNEPSGAAAESPSPSRTEMSQGSYDFLKSGTLYRGVNLGSGSGLSLKSGLNLELQGKIAEDVTIIGALTDKNIPIQPEGNTQTLNEIDKVFIRVNMPREQFTFGDYELSLPESELGRYQRKLQGVYGESQRGKFNTAAGGAVTKGRYYSNYFQGEEGNQGPYQLTGREGETAIIVLAGTEQVWLDGELQLRGESNDYVIDYATGQITFTPNTLITTNSRITVDFQYSDLIYQRNIWMVRSKTSLAKDKFEISTSVVSESDDRNNPLELDLDKPDKQQLRQIGDQTEAALRSTVREDSNGAYVWQDSVLKFVGAGLGTHTATFYNVGQRGAYRKRYSADQIYFEWVDKTDSAITKQIKEEAVYLPAKPIKLPVEQKQYHMHTRWHPFSRTEISSEVAYSYLDRNTFSPLDDKDNYGQAIHLGARWQSPETNWGKVAFSGNLQQEGQRFQPIDRTRVVEYHRKWDIPRDSTGGQQFYEAHLDYQYQNHVRLNLEGGAFNQGSMQANRYKIQGHLRYKWLEDSKFYEERIRRPVSTEQNRTWIRRYGFAKFDVWQLHPYTRWYYEQRQGDVIVDNDFQFLEQTYGIQSATNQQFTWRIENHIRQDNDLSDQQWRKAAYAQNLRFSGKIYDWHTLTSEWNFTRRKKKYFHAQQLPDVKFYLLNFMLTQAPRQSPLRWETNMKIEEERTIKKEERYYFAGQGEGQYIYDSTYADYIPHPQGDFIRQTLPSEIREPVTSFQNGLRVQFNGVRLKARGKEGLLTRLSTRTDIRLQQQIKKAAHPLQQWRFSPAAVDSNWVHYYRVIQQDINYRMSSLQGYLRFRYRNIDRASQLDVRGQENSIDDEYSLRYKGAFILPLQLESELSVNQLHRESAFNSLRDRNIVSLGSESIISLLIDRVNHFKWILTLNRDRQQGQQEINAFLSGFRTIYERKLSGKGRWEVFAEFDNVQVQPAGTVIPYEMGRGKQSGTTWGWGGAFEYRIGKYLSVRVNYEGWNEPSRGLYHLGSAVVRAVF